MAEDGGRRTAPQVLLDGAARRLLQRPTVAEREAPLRSVRIAEVRRETPSAVTLVLEDAGDGRGSFDFRRGQFFTLVADIDGRPVRRAYSAASAPGASRLEVTVKYDVCGLPAVEGHPRHRVTVLVPGQCSARRLALRLWTLSVEDVVN